MIIQSIRLQNIKSYGDGPDGEGVTVTFQPGINRIAGRNGHGKSTLIESLGYALFLAEPQYAENFQLATYLLRNGAKAGEIDVTFGHGGETYRVERGVGAQSRRRPKVVDCADGSICAEGDEEVRQFLCRLFRLGDAKRLAELFEKLVGVKQGRLTLPFDSKPAEAKRFFEPLLEVDVFRHCFDSLKPVVDQIEDLIHGQQEDRAAAQARVEERQDSAEKLDAASKRVAELTEKLETARREEAGARKAKQRWEELERCANAAREAWQTAKAAADASAEAVRSAKQQLDESERAAATVRDHQAAHETFRAAEARLKDLATKRTARDRLLAERGKAEKGQTQMEERSKAAGDQAKALEGDRAKREKALAESEARAKKIDGELADSAEAFKRQQRSAKEAGADRERIQGFIDGLPEALEDFESRAETIGILGDKVAAWDAKGLTAARDGEGSAAEALEAAIKELTKAQAREKSLSEQLEQIKGGLCPFLKEACRQFDPSKVREDLAEVRGAVTRLEAKADAARKAHQKAKKALDTLQKAEGQFTEDRAKLTGEIREFRRLATALAAPVVASAAERLRRWQDRVQPMPPAPGIDGIDTTPAGVVVLHGCVKQFAAAAAAWWQKQEAIVAQSIQEADDQASARQRMENESANLRETIGQLKVEVASLAEKVAGQKALESSLAARAEAEAKRIAEVDGQMAPLATVPDEIQAEEARRDANRAGHEKVLAARDAAGKLEERRQALAESDAKQRRAADAVREKEATRDNACKAFDPLELGRAREAHEGHLKTTANADTDLRHARAEREAQERRQKEWQAACAARDRIDAEIARLKAGEALAELARKVLRDSAPAVAQHLCDRIAARAQRTFNRINHEAAELSWDAGHYSLRIAPGDRRFAMLSGGEQTKLALSMTLAMIEEFSGQRLCIFDEPTYGVDADSRHRLADAVLELHQAAGLEQLLLVSHDDAFEGKIENAVVLDKTRPAGSRLAHAD